MRKRIFMGMALAFGLLGITACGKTESVPKEGEKTTLKVALWDYSNLGYYKAMFEKFEEKYPDISIEPIEFAADEYDDTLITQLGGKQDFDIVFTKGTPAMSGLASQGHIYDLASFIAEDKEFSKEAYSGLVDQLSIDGKTYGLPFRKDNWILYYNKDLFDAAGVAYPEDGMTMEEYTGLARSLTKGSGNEKVYGAHSHIWPSCVSDFATRLGDFNPADVDSYDNLKPYYESILNLQGEGIIQDYGALKASNIHYSGVFYNQEIAMLPMGTWFINMCVENVDFNWGVASLPNDKGVGNELAAGGVTPVSIGAYSKNPEKAWILMKFLCGEEGATILANSGIVPGYSSGAIGEIFDALPKTHSNAPEGLSAYLTGKTHYIEMPAIKQAKAIDTIMKEEHSAIMTNSVSVEEGIANMKSRVAEALKE